MIQQILQEMIRHDQGDAPRIQHFVKVYTFAHMIAMLERMEPDKLFVLDIACIMHDIGIHAAEEKYGNCQGKYQEELGPDEARELLKPFDLDKDIVERVCFLIGHHHTYDQVDGMDYQILLEADFLVNAFEEKLNQDAICKFRDQIFKTESGIEALNRMFNL